MRTKVSIIIPVYNAEKYLDKCLESVVNQSYLPFEVILVDDGSRDASSIICQKWAQNVNYIHVISQANSGVSVARNKGIESATGDWLCFVDPDDFLDSEMIHTLVSLIDDKTDIVISSCAVFSSKGLSSISHFFAGDRTFDIDKSDLYFQLMDKTYMQVGIAYTAVGVPWSKLYRREFVVQRHLLFNPSLRRMQDNLFNSYAFYYARIVRYIDKPLYFYRFDHFSDYSHVDYAILYQNVKNILFSREKFLKDTGLIHENRFQSALTYEQIRDAFQLVNEGVMRIRDATKGRKRFDEVSDHFQTALKTSRLSRQLSVHQRVEVFLIRGHYYRAYRVLWKLFISRLGKFENGRDVAKP
jgi:glycosyltransferase involved in cell wall biosynthesis